MESCIIVPAKITGFCHRLPMPTELPQASTTTPRRNSAFSPPGFDTVPLILAITRTISRLIPRCFDLAIDRLGTHNGLATRAGPR
jgi:hypothetical protein